MALLEVKNLGITFGGLHAVDNFNLTLEKGALYGLIGPNGAGKTTVFNLLTGVYKPTTGTFFLDGKEMKGKKPAEINKAGIARTFQNIRLFNNMTVIRNVMVGLHNRPEYKCSVVESIFRLPRHFKMEKEMREKAKELLADPQQKVLDVMCACGFRNQSSFNRVFLEYCGVSPREYRRSI